VTKFKDLQLREVDVAVLRLRPGDVLVFKTNLKLDKDQTMFLNERIREHMDRAGLQDNKFMFLTSYVDVSVIRREEEQS
jgi:hypothetical protein